MACGYMGCRTPMNKVAWVLFGMLLGLAAVLLGIGLAKTIPCSRTFIACMNENPQYLKDKNVCTVPYRHCARSHIIVAGAGAVAALVALSVVCCMCCFSKPPTPKPAAGQPYSNMAGVVQMQHGYPTAAPAGAMGQQQYPYSYTPYQGQQAQQAPVVRY